MPNNTTASVSSSKAAIATMNAISLGFSRYFLSLMLLLGIIGLSLNTLIYTRKALRNNSCVQYFLASTIANYFVVFFVLPSRILSDGFAIDPGTYNLGYCKLRFFTYFTGKSLASWFIVLACFDRKMSSSRNARFRSFSRPAVARWMILGMTIALCVYFSHVLVTYTIEKKACNPITGIYRFFNDSLYVIGYSLTPPILMLIFGSLTIRDMKRLGRVAAQTAKRQSMITKRDRGLMLMLLLEVILTTLTAIPHAVQKLYATSTANNPKSDYVKAGDSLFSTIVRCISFFNHSCSFYILTLSGRMFREELKKIINEYCCRFRDRRRKTMTVTMKTTQTKLN